MKLSVIIPYYNGEQWVSKCLDSLLHQDIDSADYEIIVVDDGSTNNIDILKGYTKKYPNIIYLWQENARHSAARNNGLSIAQGDYVFFCDCDDYVAENVFGRLCDIAKTGKADVLLFNYRIVKENETAADAKRNFDSVEWYESGLSFMAAPPQKVFAGPWEYIVRRQFLKEKALAFAPEMIMREEFLFFLQMMLAAGTVARADVDVYYYVQHATSWVGSLGKKKNHERYIECMLQFSDYLKDVRERLKAKYGEDAPYLEAMERLQSAEAFIMLHNTFRYGSLSNNVQIIRTLKNKEFYPIKNNKGKYGWLINIMNIYPLWILACAMFHILPQKIRFRIL